MENAFSQALQRLYANSIATAVALLWTTSVAAQSIVVGEDRPVGSPSKYALVEPFVAVHPTNPQVLVAVAIEVTSSDLRTASCVAFTTFDGLTWLRHAFDAPRCADPWVTVLRDGAVLVAGLVTLPDGKSNLFVYRSPDGRTWNEEPMRFGGGHDHEMFVMDTSAGRLGGSMYLVSGRTVRNKARALRSTVFVARSTDGGKTFPDSTQVTPSNLSFEAHGPAVLSDGTLIVPFGDHHRWAPSEAVRTPRSWAVVSRDGGLTFSEPLFISDDCFGGGGWPSLAADGSSRFRDRLYYVCARAGSIGVQVRVSNDAGESWSKPKRVDQATPDSLPTKIPMIAVNKDGIIVVTWWNLRNEARGQCMDLYASASLDGAETFTAPARVSTASSCPQTPQNDGAYQRWSAGGDYSGLAATPDGTFRAVWADSRTGVYQLRTAMISVR